MFGLGAVLCAILTGQPPFVGDTAESTRQLAAQRKLDAAFARLDECGAEQDLVALCKRCLDPDRDTRLRNGGEVASAVQAFRVEAEERARQAELDRVRAEAQGKGRGASGGTAKAKEGSTGACGIAGVAGPRQRGICLVAGSAVPQRRERLARNADAVAALLTSCEESLRAGDSAKAAVAFEAAEKRAAEGGAGDLDHRLEQCRSDLSLLRDLDSSDQFRWTPIENSFPGNKERAINYREALTRFDPDLYSPSEVARRINASSLRDRLVAVFDMWLGAEEVEEKSTAIRAVLQLVDPDPYRDTWRDAAKNNDETKLAVIANQPELIDQPPWLVAIVGDVGVVPRERRRSVLETVICKAAK